MSPPDLDYMLPFCGKAGGGGGVIFGAALRFAVAVVATYYRAIIWGRKQSLQSYTTWALPLQSALLLEDSVGLGVRRRRSGHPPSEEKRMPK